MTPLPPAGDGARIIRNIAPIPHLELFEVGRQLNLELTFSYGDDLPPLRPAASSFERVHGPRGEPIYIHRDRDAEAEALRVLTALGLTRGRHGRFTSLGDQAYLFLLEQLPALERTGWRSSGLATLKVYRFARAEGRLEGRLRTGTAPGTFDLDLELVWDEVRLPARTAWGAVHAGQRLLRLEDGRYASVPAPVGRVLEALFSSLSATAAGTLRVDRARAPFVANLLRELRIDADEAWNALLLELQAPPEQRPVETPRSFRGALRPYQAHGLRWLCLLRDSSLGGILADDMGLGKTVQVLALLLLEKEQRDPGPSLVVAPSSVVENWAAEASRFAPRLKVLSLVGPTRRRLEASIDDADLVLTSYTLMRRDLALHRRHPYHYVILDEAQYIKNPRSLTARAARRLQGLHRLALTGTPIENRLDELWSQFAFVMPQLLGSIDAFRVRYALPIEQTDDADRRAELRRRVGPFILRRLKEEVEKELPPRTDTVLTCGLEGPQLRLYLAVLRAARSQVFDALDTRGLQRARMTILTALMRLRQICCDPRLVGGLEGLDPELTDLLDECARHDPVNSAKLQLFHELLEEILEAGHRVLVFSQFVTMLRLLRDELEKRGVPYEYLDGQTRDRQALVDRFNSGTAPVFLISLRAGGTGLNLTGADYVIHFDPWWNPAVEAQATDRAHRIGQTRPVFSYKLITRGTIEERMLELQARKRRLATEVLDAGRGLAASLSRQDLEYLLAEG